MLTQWEREFHLSLSEDESVEFRLTYDGPLPHQSDNIRAVKHNIRAQLHPQLKDLCIRVSAFTNLVDQLRGKKKAPFIGVGYQRPNYEAIGAKYRFDGFEFIPLVIGALHMVCHLDILFLRREKTGSLIVKPKDEYGGDLDNRLKIFLDALRAPRDLSELPKGTSPTGEPMYCLLEDDSLITKFQVESDTLLGDEVLEKQKHVRLVVRVTTKITQTALYNLDFGM